MAEHLEGLRRELARLGERIAALEAAGTGRGARSRRRSRAARPPTPAAAARPTCLSEELVLVISAAVAAFLGKKAHDPADSPARLGAPGPSRAASPIQASHALSVHSTRSRLETQDHGRRQGVRGRRRGLRAGAAAARLRPAAGPRRVPAAAPAAAPALPPRPAPPRWPTRARSAAARSRARSPASRPRSGRPSRSTTCCWSSRR